MFLLEFKRSSQPYSENEKIELGDGLQLFGEDFFDSIQTSYMPINEPNLDSSYVLDFGDQIEIQLVGQNNTTNKYVINREGSISIADVGKISIYGLSFDKASDLIRSKINDTYIGTKVFVSITNIRDVRVMVAGNAYNPGIYTLGGNSNLLHALSVAAV